MKAAVLRRPGSVALEDVEVDAPRPREVLVRVAAAGVCHSDLNFVTGAVPTPMPIVLGHEGAGVVEAIGDEVTYVAVGDRVATCVSLFCGECRQCLSGRPNLCTARPGRGPEDEPRLTAAGSEVHQLRGLGAFAEEMLVHENSVVKLPPGVGLDVGCLLGCGVLTGTGAVFRTASVRAGEAVAVIGCGGVGLNVIQAARLAGAAPIIAVDRLAPKLEQARRFGATHVVDGSVEEPVERVRALSGGGVDHAFEAIGLPAAAEEAVEMLAPAGTATIVGVMGAEERFSVRAWTLLLERRIQGCVLGSNRFRLDVPVLAELYLEGRLELDSLVAERLPLDRIDAAFEAMEAGLGARSVLVLDQDLS